MTDERNSSVLLHFSQLTKELVEFTILDKHLNSEIICEIFNKYNSMEYGQLVGFCTDHASEDMSATRLLGTSKYGCLFHKLHLVVGSIAHYHNDVVKWVVEAMSFMHSSYEGLAYIVNEKDSHQ